MTTILPMLAQKALLGPFDSQDHLFEVKEDGVRVLAIVDPRAGTYQLVGRSGANYTAAFPELDVLPKIATLPCVLDGEAVVLQAGSAEKGQVSDFRAVASRVHRTGAARIRAGVAQALVTLKVFDVLEASDKDLTAQGYRVRLEDRRTLLGHLLTPCERVQLVSARDNDGTAFFQEVIALGGEGVMAKTKSGLYYPGQRSSVWQKIKGVAEETFYVGGWTAGTGWRAPYFGALLLGTMQEDGTLFYTGSVGSGFTNEDLETLIRVMRERTAPGPVTGPGPFTTRPDEPNIAGFTSPSPLSSLQVDVKFHERTPDGKLRFPVFVKLRET